MKWLNYLALGILAGLSIGLGSAGFVGCVACGQKAIGAFVFATGLLLVCSFRFCLYTGKIGYFFEQNKEQRLALPVMYAGNFIGAAGLGLLFYFSAYKNSEAVRTALDNITSSRLIFAEGGESFYSAIFLGIICGMLVFLAVHVFNKAENYGVKVTGLVLCVACFVICGSEHCIANMFYYAAAGVFSWPATANIIFVTLGNSIGSLIVYGLLKLASLKKKEKKPEEIK